MPESLLAHVNGCGLSIDAKTIRTPLNQRKVRRDKQTQKNVYFQKKNSLVI